MTESNFPNFKCAMYLQCNDHKNIYQSAADWIVDNLDHYHWKDDSAIQRAIDTDTIWTLQWYPDTPVGCYAVAAPTLHEVLEMANA